MISMVTNSDNIPPHRAHSIIRGAVNDDIDEVLHALNEDASCITLRDEKMGVTALHVAAGDGNMPLVDFLLKQPGVDPLLQDYAGRLPSSMALAIGRLDIFDKISEAMLATLPSEPDPDGSPSNVLKIGFRPPSP